MSQLTPFDYSGKTVRTVMIDGEPWFVAADVCLVLGYNHTPSAIRRLNADEYQQVEFSQVEPNVRRDGPPPRPMTVVTEGGLYSLILWSQKPEAKAFKRWITHEVLPAIRRNGSYALVPQSFAEALELAAKQQRAIEERDKRLAIAEPKAQIAEFWLESEDSIKIVEWAKKFGMTQPAMYKLLRDKNIIFKQRDPQSHKDYIQAPKRGYEDCFEQVQEWIGHLRRYVPVLLITPVGQDRLAKELGLLSG